MRLEEERDALQAELARLIGDRGALASARRATWRRSALFVVLRILGVIGIVLGIVPMVMVVVALLAAGEVGAGLACAIVPLIATGGLLMLKLPHLVQALERRVEEKRRKRRDAELAARYVRVPAEHGAQSEATVPAEVQRYRRAQR